MSDQPDELLSRPESLSSMPGADRAAQSSAPVSPSPADNQVAPTVPPAACNTQSAPDPQRHDPQVKTEQTGYNDPFWLRGVCARAEAPPPAAAAPEPQVTPAPVISDQTATPGAPPALAAAISAPVSGSAELSTGAHINPQNGGSSERDHDQSPAVGQPGAAPTRPNPGRPHAMKPQTSMQIRDFMARWSDAAYSLAQIAQHYHCAERTIQDWRKDFGLSPRPEALKQAAKARSILSAAAGMVDAVKESAAVEGQVMGTSVNPDTLDPAKDSEIAEALSDIQSEARIMSTHSDLSKIQRKFCRLNILIATKTPPRSWESLQVTIDNLSKSLLHARRVEAEIPEGAVDEVALRKAAASQMCAELKAVLNSEEQGELARVMLIGVDRIMAQARAKGASDATNDLPGGPTSLGHNGKVKPGS